ncbi:hypothetical protein M427DRAFT_66022 [Gonapodya prolifera JEL478]|uniref:SigF-like NTF2-like domain-containing protein n=1 Tax=Gonapodya prolifera (strain JEL478) TaxID=1344416 RepID=A0A139AX37_GONPJ|nr:hypothetical protein M427DRAFT_66022 [Gonapodya prolifera JEL478]|eukprot:KXS21269.1 hypothetical protein M427DRAFT_66022 [Gonapodya prolifera JEL478]
MDDPPYDISKLLTKLLDVPPPIPSLSKTQEEQLSRQKYAIAESVTDDVEFIHPWGKVKGRENVAQVYEFWTRQLWSNRASINVTAWNPDAGLLVVDVEQEFVHKYRHNILAFLPIAAWTIFIFLLCIFWPFFIPLLFFLWWLGSGIPALIGLGLWAYLNGEASVRTIAFIWLVKGTDNGKWRIRKQEDFYPADRLFDAITSGGWLYDIFVQSFGGLLWTGVILPIERAVDGALLMLKQ